MNRSFPVTLAQWLVLITLAWNIIRLWTAIGWKGALTEFSTGLSPIVSALAAGIWVATCCIIYWGIWQEKAWASKMLLGTAAAYSAWYWSERLFFQNPRPNTIFAVIVNLGLFIIIHFATKSLSREAHERKNENPGIE